MFIPTRCCPCGEIKFIFITTLYTNLSEDVSAIFKSMTKHYAHCWKSTFQPKKLWCCPWSPWFNHRLLRHTSRYKITWMAISPLASRWRLLCMACPGRASTDRFPAGVRILLVKDYRLLPRLQVALADDWHFTSSSVVHVCSALLRRF